MADTTYDALNKAVTDDRTLITTLNGKLSSLQNDTGINSLRYKLDRTASIPNQWIDGNGVYWTGNDAFQIHSQALQAVIQNNADQALINGQLVSANKKLIEDIAAVTNYQKTSPTLVSQLKTDADLALAKIANNKVLIIGGVIALIVIVIIVLIIKKTKKNGNN